MPNLNDSEAVVEEEFSYFTYVKVATPKCKNTQLCFKVFFHQNVVKVSKGLIMQNDPSHVSVILLYLILL